MWQLWDTTGMRESNEWIGRLTANRTRGLRVGGAIEVAEAGAQIEIVPTGDEQRITDAVQRLLVTEAVAAPNMSDFSWDHVVDQYLAVFTQ